MFVKKDEGEDVPSSPEISRSNSRKLSLPVGFDELPLELQSYADRFLESLSQKSFNEPPTIDTLAEIFQEFYLKANQKIATHIAVLHARLNRSVSPAPSQSSIKSRASKSSKDPTESQQMLSATEVIEKRKAKKLLEYKKVLLEEAMEKRVCEKVYTKLWRHNSTLDEVRDEKLRSKTASLSLINIGLKELGVDIEQGITKSEDDIRDDLSSARESLALMNNEKYPLGKLKHLNAAHKSVVEILGTIKSGSASADDILPTLIFTLITSPFGGINVVSNLYYIERFRARSKLDGEAAYCMTNLEAAIGFLENVDLSSLRADEALEGPPRISRPHTPTIDEIEPFPNISPIDMPTTETTSASVTGTFETPKSPTKLSAPNNAPRPTSSPSSGAPAHSRKLSNLLDPPAKAFGAASDAARTTAEDAIRDINNALDNSFKFFLSKINASTNASQNAPKTLEEARQLVNQPLVPDDESMLSEVSSLNGDSESSPVAIQQTGADKILSMISGRPKSNSISKSTAQANHERERSVDSINSTGSGKRVNFVAASSNLVPASSNPSVAPEPSKEGPVVPSSNKGPSLPSLNPFPTIGSAFGGGFRSFSKAISTTPALGSPKREENKQLAPPVPSPGPTSTNMVKVDSAELVKVEPPIRRFMEAKHAGDLQIKDVELLLKDYQRLAGVLRDLGAGAPNENGNT